MFTKGSLMYHDWIYINTISYREMSTKGNVCQIKYEEVLYAMYLHPVKWKWGASHRVQSLCRPHQLTTKMFNYWQSIVAMMDRMTKVMMRVNLVMRVMLMVIMVMMVMMVTSYDASFTERERFFHRGQMAHLAFYWFKHSSPSKLSSSSGEDDVSNW